jgi:hypothetical protein
MHLLSRVVTESEEGAAEQVPEEGQPSVEVGFDIYGSSEELTPLLTKASPEAYNPFLVFTNTFIIRVL